MKKSFLPFLIGVLFPLLLQGQVASVSYFPSNVVKPLEQQLSLIAFDKKKRRRKEGETFLQLQGGLLIDLHNVTATKDYVGPAYFSFGFGRWSDNKIRGLEIDASLFEANNPYDTICIPGSIGRVCEAATFQWIRRKGSIDASTYHLYPFLKNDRWWIGGGPQISLGFSKHELTPNTAERFPQYTNDFRIGIGGRSTIFYRLSSKIYGQFGLKVVLLDVGFRRHQNRNPLLPKQQQITKTFLADLIHSQFYFPLGITILL